MVATGLLSGYRIVDNSWAAAGPYATEVFALLGAEVIKVETSSHPDLFRRIVDDPSAGLDASTRFNALNLSKKGLRLNLQKSAGLEIFRRLIETSDAFVENYRPGVVERLRISYTDLVQVKPDLVMLSISAAGNDGPQSSHPGYASVFNALGGLGHMTGYRDGPPTEVRDSVDLRVGAVAALALIAALLHRKRTGQGQWVDVSAREATASYVGDALTEFGLTCVSPIRDGNHLGLNAPYDVFRCAGEDSWVAIGVSTDEEWAGLAEAMSRPELGDDERFADRLSRHEHRDELDALVSAWTAARGAPDAAACCRSHGVPASQVLGGGDLLKDSHLNARNVIQTVTHPVLGSQLVVRGPWRLGVTDEQPLEPSPTMGQHNEVLLKGLLGYTRDEIEQFQAAGAFE